MKKLFSLVVLFVLSVSFMGCEISRQDQNDDVVYGGTVVFEVVIDDEVLRQEVEFLDEDKVSAFDLLVSLFEVEYLEMDFGPMLLSIDALSPSYGSFILISVNGESASVGIDGIKYEDGDVIRFEKAWWDPEAERVRSLMDAFMENHYLQYLESFNFYAYAGFAHTGLLSELVETYEIEFDVESVSDMGSHIRAIIALEAMQEDYASLSSNLFDMAAIGWPYMTSLMMIALQYDGALDLEDLVEDYIADLVGRNIETIDMDTLSLMLMALTLIEHSQSDALIEAIVDVIEVELYASSFGNNSATLSHVIMALINAEIDPREARYNYDEETSLVSYFLDFAFEDGSFRYGENDENSDLMFSTPQAFLALVMLDQMFNGQMGSPFIFSE